jgi:flagellar hook assembly protein FlgD
MSIYPVSAATSNATNPTASTTSTSDSATDYQSMFMQLLATELQSQDPTQTMDPTTMVTQMVQINQLSDVAGIYSILQGNNSSGTTADTSSGAVDASSPVVPATSHSAQNILGGN